MLDQVTVRAACKQYQWLREHMEAFAETYNQEFGNTRESVVTHELYFEDGMIYFAASEYFKGNDYISSYAVPVSYLWDPNWRSVETARQATKRQKLDIEQHQRDAAKKERRRQQFQELKVEFEP